MVRREQKITPTEADLMQSYVDRVENKEVPALVNAILSRLELLLHDNHCSAESLLKSFFDLNDKNVFERPWTHASEGQLLASKNKANESSNWLAQVNDPRLLAQILLDYLESLSAPPICSENTVNTLCDTLEQFKRNNCDERNIKWSKKPNRSQTYLLLRIKMFFAEFRYFTDYDILLNTIRRVCISLLHKQTAFKGDFYQRCIPREPETKDLQVNRLIQLFEKWLETTQFDNLIAVKMSSMQTLARMDFNPSRTKRLVRRELTPGVASIGNDTFSFRGSLFRQANPEALQPSPARGRNRRSIAEVREFDDSDANLMPFDASHDGLHNQSPMARIEAGFVTPIRPTGMVHHLSLSPGDPPLNPYIPRGGNRVGPPIERSTNITDNQSSLARSPIVFPPANRPVLIDSFAMQSQMFESKGKQLWSTPLKQLEVLGSAVKFDAQPLKKEDQIENLKRFFRSQTVEQQRGIAAALKMYTVLIQYSEDS